MPTTRTRKPAAKVVALPVQPSIVVVRTDKAAWHVEQNGEPVRSPSGSVRRFSTERRAMLAAQRAAGIVVEDRRNQAAGKLSAKLATATPDQLAQVAALLG